MPKPTRGRAGREGRRSEQRDSYGAELAALLGKQLRFQPTFQMLHLGYPGAIALLSEVAGKLTEGELTVLVYSFDELEETQAALSKYSNVQVVNEFEELPRYVEYDVITSIVPYHLGQPYIEQLLRMGLARLKSTGVFMLGGDRQHEFERYLTVLQSLASPIATVATNGSLRVVQVEAGARRRGTLIFRP